MAILALSREYQSGGQAVGLGVAERLGYRYIDKQGIHDQLKETGGKWGALVDEFDEVRPHLWERYDWEYRGFIALVESAILEFALEDRAVIVGRGSHIVLRNIPQVLRVRLFAPLEIRIERLMNRENIDREKAKRLVKAQDKERAGYIKSIYGEKWDDRELFDLIFNTGSQAIEQVGAEIAEALREREKQTTPEGIKRLENRAMAARIKARLFIHPHLFIPTLEVFHDGQALVLKGVVHRPDELHRIMELVRQMAGFHPVRNELHLRK